MNDLTFFWRGKLRIYIIYAREGGDCQWDCDNKSKDRIYNSGTCSSYSRTCEAQPKDSARKRHSARQHQTGQATRCKRIASTYKFMRSQVRNQKFISSTSQKKFKKSCKHFVILKTTRTFAPFSKRNESRDLKQCSNESQATGCKWRCRQHRSFGMFTRWRIRFMENYTGA